MVQRRIGRSVTGYRQSMGIIEILLIILFVVVILWLISHFLPRR